MSDETDTAAVKHYLLALQDTLCGALEMEDGAARFRADDWSRDDQGPTALRGAGRIRALSEGDVFEKAGIAFSHVRGSSLPPSATRHRPHLAGQRWEALGVSLVIHPRNPYVPTSHANVRFFRALGRSASPVNDGADPAGDISDVSAVGSGWWFGGGFDLTPYYGFEEDCVHWHRTARAALEPFGLALYRRCKSACDDYFFLEHRREHRGIGGVFLDDFNEFGFERSFALMRAVGDAFAPAYLPIVARRKAMPYRERERQFQLYRRGRYVEFNLVQDRGTLFGLQSGGRAEAILISLPPLVRWEYEWHTEPGSPEARLHELFLTPRDWTESDALPGS